MGKRNHQQQRHLVHLLVYTEAQMAMHTWSRSASPTASYALAHRAAWFHSSLSWVHMSWISTGHRAIDLSDPPSTRVLKTHCASRREPSILLLFVFYTHVIDSGR